MAQDIKIDELTTTKRYQTSVGNDSIWQVWSQIPATKKMS